MISNREARLRFSLGYAKLLWKLLGLAVQGTKCPCPVLRFLVRICVLVIKLIPLSSSGTISGNSIGSQPWDKGKQRRTENPWGS